MLEVGTKVYQHDAIRVYESTIQRIDVIKNRPIYDTNGVAFDETAIGKSIFLTHEDAESRIAK